MICSNTTHIAADAVKEATGLPFIHLIDALAAEIEMRNSKSPLLLGTPFVMENEFYRRDLEEKFGVRTLVPDAAGRAETSRIIFEDLVKGEVAFSSKTALLEFIADAATDGADGVILGCAELSLILSQADMVVPVFDTTSIHAKAASDFAFGGD